MQRASLARVLATELSGSRLCAWALLGGLGVLAWFELLPCPFASSLGLPCPGCGLSRAAHLLLAGDWDASLALHPLSPVVVPLVVLGSIWMVRVELGGAPHPAPLHPVPFCSRRVVDVSSLLLVVLLLAVWVARFVGAFGGPVAI